MTGRLLVTLAIATLPLHVAIGQTDDGPTDDWHALVAAERAFAADSVAHGIKTAFLTWLADDALIFRPSAVEGRPPPRTQTTYFECFVEDHPILRKCVETL